MLSEERARFVRGGRSSNWTGLVTIRRSIPAESVTAETYPLAVIWGSSRISSGPWTGAHWPSSVWSLSTQYAYGFARNVAAMIRPHSGPLAMSLSAELNRSSSMRCGRPTSCSC